MEMPIPNAAILSKRDRVIARLAAELPSEALISDEAEPPPPAAPYECPDALTAYRCLPMAVVLPDSTETGRCQS